MINEILLKRIKRQLISYAYPLDETRRNVYSTRKRKESNRKGTSRKFEEDVDETLMIN